MKKFSTFILTVLNENSSEKARAKYKEESRERRQIDLLMYPFVDRRPKPIETHISEIMSVRPNMSLKSLTNELKDRGVAVDDHADSIKRLHQISGRVEVQKDRRGEPSAFDFHDRMRAAGLM